MEPSRTRRQLKQRQPFSDRWRSSGPQASHTNNNNNTWQRRRNNLYHRQWSISLSPRGSTNSSPLFWSNPPFVQQVQLFLLNSTPLPSRLAMNITTRRFLRRRHRRARLLAAIPAPAVIPVHVVFLRPPLATRSRRFLQTALLRRVMAIHVFRCWAHEHATANANRSGVVSLLT